MNLSTRSLFTALAFLALPAFAADEIPDGWETKRLTQPGCFRRVIIAGARAILPRNLDLATTQKLSRLAYHFKSESQPPVNARERRSVYRIVGTGRSEYIALYNITHDLHYTIWQIDGQPHLRIELMDSNWLMRDSRGKVQFKLAAGDIPFLTENRDPNADEGSIFDKFNAAALTHFQSDRLKKLRDIFMQLKRESRITNVFIQGDPEVLVVGYKTGDRTRTQKCIIRPFPAGFQWVLIDQQDQNRFRRSGSYNYTHFGMLSNGGIWLGDHITREFMGKPAGFEELGFATLWDLSKNGLDIPEWAENF